MEPRQRRALDTNRLAIQDITLTPTFYAYLIQYDIFTDDVIHMIQNAPGGTSHNVLVEELKKQPQQHFFSFLSILHSTRHTYVARKIERSFDELGRGNDSPRASTPMMRVRPTVRPSPRELDREDAREQFEALKVRQPISTRQRGEPSSDEPDKKMAPTNRTPAPVGSSSRCGPVSAVVTPARPMTAVPVMKTTPVEEIPQRGSGKSLTRQASTTPSTGPKPSRSSMKKSQSVDDADGMREEDDEERETEHVMHRFLSDVKKGKKEKNSRARGDVSSDSDDDVTGWFAVRKVVNDLGVGKK